MDAYDEVNTRHEKKIETPNLKENDKGVKVYDPPEPRVSFPTWLLILVVVLALVTSWLIYQALM
jgi:hypothetical protein